MTSVAAGFVKAARRVFRQTRKEETEVYGRAV